MPRFICEDEHPWRFKERGEHPVEGPERNPPWHVHQTPAVRLLRTVHLLNYNLLNSYMLPEPEACPPTFKVRCGKWLAMSRRYPSLCPSILPFSTSTHFRCRAVVDNLIKRCLHCWCNQALTKNLTGPFDAGPENTANLLSYSGYPFQVPCNHEVPFDASTFSTNLGFQHVPLPPFPARMHLESNNFELPITSSSAGLASSALECPQPVPRPQPSSAPIPSFTSQTGRSRYLECLICSKKFKRIARANACFTAHFNVKLYVCDTTCGNPDWSVAPCGEQKWANFGSLNSFISKSEYGSIETLRRHCRPLNRRNTSCPKW